MRITPQALVQMTTTAKAIASVPQANASILLEAAAVQATAATVAAKQAIVAMVAAKQATAAMAAAKQVTVAAVAQSAILATSTLSVTHNSVASPQVRLMASVPSTTSVKCARAIAIVSMALASLPMTLTTLATVQPHAPTSQTAPHSGTVKKLEMQMARTAHNKTSCQKRPFHKA